MIDVSGGFFVRGGDAACRWTRQIERDGGTVAVREMMMGSGRIAEAAAGAEMGRWRKAYAASVTVNAERVESAKE